MIYNDTFLWLFYHLSINDHRYISSQELSDRLGVSVRTIKNKLSTIEPFIKDYGCHLESKRRYGYRLIIDDVHTYEVAKTKITNYIKYSHSYKNTVNDIFSYIVNRYIFSEESFSKEEIASELFITPSAFNRYFSSFVEQLETFDLKLKQLDNKEYRVVGREKDLRLLAKDFLVINITEITNRDYDFNQLYWANPEYDFYKIHNIVQKVLSKYDIRFFEVGKLRISCYFYISCIRQKYPIDIRVDNIAKYINETDLNIAYEIIQAVREYNASIYFSHGELISLALNIMCERDFTTSDIENKTVSKALQHYTQHCYELITSYKHMEVLKLFPKDEIILWMISVSARIVASNHKQNKPYFYYNDKSVYYSSFSFFLARLLASFIKKRGYIADDITGPTLNIYCISYLTNMFYTHMMLQEFNCRKLNIGVYSFLGISTSNSIIKYINRSSLGHFINEIKTIDLNDSLNDELDLVLYHQEIEYSVLDSSLNKIGLRGKNLVDQKTIYEIKAKYLETSNYKIYLRLLDHIRILEDEEINHFDSIISKYKTFEIIKHKYQLVYNYNTRLAFLFVDEKEPVFDIYVLKDKFSSEGHRFKRLLVISVDLTNQDITYYKTMEALSQVLSRNMDIANLDDSISSIKKNISSEIERYLVDTLF